MSFPRDPHKLGTSQRGKLGLGIIRKGWRAKEKWQLWHRGSLGCMHMAVIFPVEEFIKAQGGSEQVLGTIRMDNQKDEAALCRSNYRGSNSLLIEGSETGWAGG